MSRKTILGWSVALLSALGMTLAMPSDAHARRRCYNNGYNNGWYGHNGRTYASTAPTTATSPCAGTPAPTNPDGTMAPQPEPAAPPSPAAPDDVPPPAPPSTTK
jgi:hypothetical protein